MQRGGWSSLTRSVSAGRVAGKGQPADRSPTCFLEADSRLVSELMLGLAPWKFRLALVQKCTLLRYHDRWGHSRTGRIASCLPPLAIACLQSAANRSWQASDKPPISFAFLQPLFPARSK